jgi:hypothetical protein
MSMTEGEWLTCSDPEPMLGFLLGRVSERKVRLFACGCCRRIWHLVTRRRSRRAVEVVERYCDGLADAEELRRAEDAATAAFMDAPDNSCDEMVSRLSADLAGRDAWRAALSAGEAADVAAHVAVYGVDPDEPATEVSEAAYRAARHAERALQCSLLRDLVGNPFRSTAIDPCWLTRVDGTVRRLAQVIHDERRFGDLPVLADALEEAGCTDADILGHCRSGGEHVRGCWVVDALLGKE